MWSLYLHRLMNGGRIQCAYFKKLACGSIPWKMNFLWKLRRTRTPTNSSKLLVSFVKNTKTLKNRTWFSLDDSTILSILSCRKLEVFLATNSQVNPAHDLRPHIVDLWNRLKGGQDVVSRQMSNIKVDFGSCLLMASLLTRR